MDFVVVNKNDKAKIELNTKRIDDILFVNVRMSQPEEAVPEQFTVKWEYPLTTGYCVWRPEVNAVGALRAYWDGTKRFGRLASWMPIQQIIASGGKNSIAVAISDCMVPTEIASGVIEENACLGFKVSFFTLPTTPIKEYEATIRIDLRDVPYYDSLYDISDWWERDCGYTPAYVPDAARMPMDSLWYSFHQNLDTEEILKECAESRKFGMETVIIDDGWQTDDSSRGYSYCGDWEPTPNKIKSMPDLVSKLHDMGMKIILWYSVPFVGENSKIYDRFKDKFLNDKPLFGAYTLDPRYKDVRDYLISVYVDAVKNWGLDGLKLDFIDNFTLTQHSMGYDSRRDYQSLEDAVDALMTDIKNALTAINPEFLLEFRESYVGPAIRKYGNMLRVADCPGDAIVNREQIVNLRYTSGKTAVHSDMLVWNKEAPVERAALQFTSVLYGVPQISLKIYELPEDHKKMLGYYVSFWKKYRNVLLDGKVVGKNPECHYTQVYSVLDNMAIFTAYADPVIDAKTEKVIAVNATGEKHLLIKNCKDKPYKVVNCMGEEIGKGVIKNSFEEIEVPLSGMIFIGEI